MTSLSAAPELQRSRTELAMHAMTLATEEIQRLEDRLELAFDRYLTAQDQCQQNGLAIDYEMTPAMAAGFSEFKQRRFREDLRNGRV